MAKKKAKRQSTKKGSSSKSKASSKAKPKASASTKKKAVVKGKAKTKVSSTKKSAASKKVKNKPVAKAKPKTTKVAKKSKPTKKITKKPSSSSAKKKPTILRVKASKPKKVVSKAQPKASPKRTLKKSATSKAEVMKQAGLSAVDRYNVGGLLACAIDQAGDPGLRKLRKALKHLALSVQEQENLVRLTQGFMIPKLFADEIKDEATRRLAVKELVGFAKTEAHYERDWQSDLEQFSIWLGIAI